MSTTPLSCHDRVPLESAIDLIEQLQLDEDAFVRLTELHEEAERAGPAGDGTKELHWWLDHTIALLVNRGYLRRLHLGPGELAYRPTSQWHDRDTLLKDLRPPKARIRWARMEARQIQKAERKAERDRIKADERAARKAEWVI
jgi:hypothetical protein